MVALSAPPFHQMPLPESPVPARKLQVVRLSIDTPFAFHTTTPLRPTVLPSEPSAPYV